MERDRNWGVASKEDDRLVHREVELPAPPDRVWSALTEADELSVWFGAEVTLDPRRGGRLAARWPDGRERTGVVEEVEPGRRLAFRWLPFERHPGGEVLVLGPGRVAFDLEPVPGGTRLSVWEWGPREWPPSVLDRSPSVAGTGP